jgi:membrane associated rhomboid family serine protease
MTDGVSEQDFGALQRVSSGKTRRLPKSLGGPIPVIVAVLIAAWIGGLFLPGGTLPLGVSGRALAEGRWWTPLSCVFVHAGIWHLWMNASAMSWGLPLQERMPGLRGYLVFIGFFLLCGAIGSLGYVAWDLTGSTPAVGASGAICGLWGAAARLPIAHGDLVPLTERPVRRHVVAFVVSNAVLMAILAFIGVATAGQPVLVAWQAHAAGFLAGLLLAGPTLKLAGWTPAPADSVTGIPQSLSGVLRET